MHPPSCQHNRLSNSKMRSSPICLQCAICTGLPPLNCACTNFLPSLCLSPEHEYGCQFNRESKRPVKLLPLLSSVHTLPCSMYSLLLHECAAVQSIGKKNAKLLLLPSFFLHCSCLRVLFRTGPRHLSFYSWPLACCLKAACSCPQPRVSISFRGCVSCPQPTIPVAFTNHAPCKWQLS